MENYQTVWNEVVSQLKLHIAPQSFEMAFSSVQKAYRKENKVYVTTTNDSEQFLLEKFHIANISKTLTEVTGTELDIKFVTPEFIEQQKQSYSLIEADPNVHNYYRNGANLNASYTFDRYVAGKSNRLAYMIGLQVADRPGEVANPLYLFGGVGLGKTHLMQAIGNQMLDNAPNTRILYCTSEKFVDDYRIASIEKKFDAFKHKYRDLDVLLIDDIQFLAKKEQTQEEFFNTFNDLYNENKQIIITSDRPASELKDMMDRLTSRFEWGMQADIQIPDMQTRIDIIKKKLSGENYNPEEFPAEVLEFVASKFTSNVRTLEGALKRLIFFATMQQAEITIELANDALKHLIKEERNTSRIDVKNIIKEVGNYYNIAPTDITSKSRKKEIALARHVAIYLMREFTGDSFPKIGDAFGGRDHTTIMHSCTKIGAAVAEKGDISNDVLALKKLFL
ncbi:MAG: chromosomal replication initiator protein DnaA [Turicibacter sp.]|nr:chromosomal replication initiator protein DnaA [Turicibacter sp.]